jgi:hypothetical protein
MTDMIEDPRPELAEDSELWTRFLSLCYDLRLLRNLITFREMGARITKTTRGYEFIPEVGPDAWDSAEFFQEIKVKCLAPYRDELVIMLRYLETEQQRLSPNVAGSISTANLKLLVKHGYFVTMFQAELKKRGVR